MIMVLKPVSLDGVPAAEQILLLTSKFKYKSCNVPRKMSRNASLNPYIFLVSYYGSQYPLHRERNLSRDKASVARGRAGSSVPLAARRALRCLLPDKADGAANSLGN